MTDLPASPKRRRILSSMNPDSHLRAARSASPSKAPASDSRPPANMYADDSADSPTEPQAPEPRAGADTEPPPKPTKFRFKSKSSHSSRRHHRSSRHDPEADPSSTHRRHHHRHKRRRRTRTPSPTPAEAPYPDPDRASLSPNTAFRESLFDAMADDEGAAYWEGVYGQPIHVYSRDGPAADDGRGELDRMTDEEYAAYVRRKMWEKTHAGLLEERARREEVKKREERERKEARRIAEEMERSLRRGEERRRRKAWRAGWEKYVAAWAGWDGGVDGLPWPTRNGTRQDVRVEGEVGRFFERGLDREEIGEREFAGRLKEERVRWHPDKIQQRLGGEVEADVMKDVTAIFQVIDRLWNDTRTKA